MNKFYLSVCTALVAVFSLAAGCNNDPKQPVGTKDGFDLFQPDTLPQDASKGEVGFRDQNCYVSDGFFCIVSLVDNGTMSWAEIWTQIEVLDSAGNLLTVKGDSSFVLRAFSKAIPPSGSTALFCAIPLALISGGTPADCRLSGAGVRYREPGAILVATESDGIRVQRPHPEDSTRVLEVAFNAYGTIENPLLTPVEHFHLVYLLYGKDGKLYFAQMIDPSIEVPSLYMEETGPLIGGDKRKIHYSILYQHLPQPLKDTLIGRLDLQAYEVR